MATKLFMLGVRTLRRALYESDDGTSGDEFVLPAMEFEEVEVAEVPKPADQDEETPAMAFLLFSSGTQTVLLAEEVEEVVVQKRPDLFYFAEYDDRRSEFAVAVSGESICRAAGSHPVFHGAHVRELVVDVAVHNARVERDARRLRPGQKKRAAKVQARKREAAREQERQAARRAERAGQHKQRPGKTRRGGKKKAAAVAAAPRFRTE